MIELDDYLTNLVTDNTDIFKNVHPNTITIIGMIINYLIYIEIIVNKTINWDKLAVMFIFRWFADCLDGNIARKYNKQSDLGNKLDTLSDISLQAVFVLYLYNHVYSDNIKKLLIISFIIYVYILITKYGILDQHDTMKTGNNCVTFIVKNTILVFIAIYYSINHLSKIKFIRM